MKSSIILSVVTVLFISAAAHAQCLGDVIPNGIVNGTDLAEVLASWGPCASCSADTNSDGQVDGQDLATVLSAWGPCGPTISTVDPSLGAVVGGAQVSIYGHFLAGVNEVSFGGVPATSLKVISDQHLVALTPRGMAGVVSVEVASGDRTATLPNSFTYIQAETPPWATLIDPYPSSSVVLRPDLRTAIIATGHAWRVRDNASQIELVLIPPGSFDMGCSASVTHGCLGDEVPVHQVTLTEPFYMGRYEVTQAQWTARMGSNPSWFREFADAANRPVDTVGWNTVQSFLAMTGTRLPTEAEWEFAYRAGAQSAFHPTASHPLGFSTDSSVSSIGWYNLNAGTCCVSNWGTKVVGQRQPNGFGLYDMTGNVMEWVQDWYSSDYFTASPTTNPPGPSSGTYRILRGGSWEASSNGCRSSYRGNYRLPNTADALIGFRVARNP